MNHEVINRVKFNWHKVSKNVVVLKGYIYKRM